MGEGMEFFVPQADADTARGFSVLTHAHPDRFAQGQQNTVRLRSLGHIGRKRHGIPVSLIRLWVGLKGIAVTPVGGVPQADAGLAQPLIQNLRVGFGKLTNGINANQLQLFFRRRAEHEQLPHGKRPELLFQLPWEKRMHLVRLFKIPCHFCKKLIAGNADIHRKTEFVGNFLPQHLRSGDGRAVQPLRTAHVRPCFVDGILLHHGRNLLQQGDQVA